MDVVGLAIARAQEAWSQGRIVGALLMDAAAAFPSVARGCLLRWMREMGLDEDLLAWTDSSMRDRRVIMSVDGQDEPSVEVTTGPPQGSPESPVLFCIYISGVYGEVESQVSGTTGISFVNDITWFIEGQSAEGVATGLERCVHESIEWASWKAVRFEASKTEAVLLSKRRGHIREGGKDRPGGREEGLFRPGGNTMARGLATLLSHTKGEQTKSFGPSQKGRCNGAGAGREVRHSPSIGEKPPAGPHIWHTPLCSGTFLDRHKEGGERGSVLTNRMGRASLGIRQITPVGIITAESALPPVRASLDHRQARFALRLLV